MLLLIGAVGIGALRDDRASAKLAPGESMRVGRYTLRYLGSDAAARRERRGDPRAHSTSRAGRRARHLLAGKNRYFAEQQTSNEVAIRSDWLRGEDLFVIADQFNADGSVFLKVLVNPLVNLHLARRARLRRSAR